MQKDCLRAFWTFLSPRMINRRISENGRINDDTENLENLQSENHNIENIFDDEEESGGMHSDTNLDLSDGFEEFKPI